MLSHGRIELAPAPFLLLALAALAIAIGLQTGAMAPANHEVPLTEFFTSGFGLRIAFEIFLYSAAAGLFVVPIFAAVQAWAGEDRRARVVGAVNALNYIFMVGGSIVTMILLQVAGLSEPMTLIVLGFANVRAAIYFFRRLPANSSPLSCVSSGGSCSASRSKAVKTCRRPGSRPSSPSTTSLSSTRRSSFR